MKRSTRRNVFWMVVPVLFASSLAFGQNATVTYPQDNVSGGAVGARRPGLRVSAGIAKHTERMAVVTAPHAGITPGTEPTARHTLILTTFLQSFFDTMQQLADTLLLAAQVGGTTTTGT